MMRTPLYIFSSGRLSRRDNSLLLSYQDTTNAISNVKHIPIENTDFIYCFGQLDCNSTLLNFLGKKGISLHFFDYYEHYTGSFVPKKQLLNGRTLVQQVLAYEDDKQRLHIAKSFIYGAAQNMLQNVKYYNRRGKNMGDALVNMESLLSKIDSVKNIAELMGIEGRIRLEYYACFDVIINDFCFEKREKRPPKDEINTLISFINMICYAHCMDTLRQTGLETTVGYLHEPSERRHSLALDIAEVFKPVLVDRVIFSLTNKKIIQPKDFIVEPDRVLITKEAKKKIVKAWDEKLNETLYVKPYNRYMSYKSIVLRECHKLQNYIERQDAYQPFISQW